MAVPASLGWTLTPRALARARAPVRARPDACAWRAVRAESDVKFEADARPTRREALGLAAAAVASAAASLSTPALASAADEAGEMCAAEPGASCAASTGGASAAGRISLSTGRGRLSVGVYPDFAYNAEGFGGEGTYRVAPDGRTADFAFPADALSIPPMSWRTASILGLPLPPFLEIRITPREATGTYDLTTGEFKMAFDAKFQLFLAGSAAFVPISVVTNLTTGESAGLFKRAAGAAIDETGAGRLVGVAVVPRTGDGFMDGFLGLPTDTLAELPVRLSFAPA
eukprot:tig00021432_g21245.t1